MFKGDFFKHIFRIALVLLLPGGAIATPEEQSEPTPEYVRVVSLSPSLTELVFQLGQEQKLVARSEVCDYPEAARELPVAGRFADPVLEHVVSFRPDLVISNDLVNPAMKKTLERYHIRVELAQCRTLDDYLHWVETLGKLLHVPQAAKLEQERVLAAREALQKQPKLALKVLYVLWDSPLMVAGAGSLCDEVIKLAGAENVMSDVETEYFKCSYDYLLKHTPDVILWGAPGAPSPRHEFWGKLDAVQKNRVITGEQLSFDLIQRPGPRLLTGVTELRKLLEPWGKASSSVEAEPKISSGETQDTRP